MNELQRIITAAINNILDSRLNVVWSWGLHNKRVITDGVRFDVQGFKFTGEVKITFDFARSHANKKSTFKVQIGDDVSTGVTAENLIDFIDERVEKVDNYEEAVKASMTPEEFAFAQSVGQVIFIWFRHVLFVGWYKLSADKRKANRTKIKHELLNY